jgi:thiol-disulfide isomerase/thioredoxin
MKKKSVWKWIVGSIIVVGGLISLLVVQANKPGKYDTVAQCINDSGAKFYGAFWCPHCQATKALFGKSARLLPYIECSQPSGKGQLPICEEAGIKGYPTWRFADGTELSGERTMAELAAKTNCTLVLEASTSSQ